MITVSGTWGADGDGGTVLETITCTPHRNRAMSISYAILSCCPRRFSVHREGLRSNFCSPIGSASNHYASGSVCRGRDGRFVTSNSPADWITYDTIQISQEDGGGACTGESFSLKICIVTLGSGTCPANLADASQPIDIT